MKRVFYLLLLVVLATSCKKERKPQTVSAPAWVPKEITTSATLPQPGSVSWGCIPDRTMCECYQFVGIDYSTNMMVFSITAPENCSYSSPYPESWPGSKVGYYQ